MRKGLISAFLLSISLCGLAFKTLDYKVTDKIQQQITTEAEDWIDDMPPGLQDRLSDAVAHAIYGFNSEIEYFRNLSDTTDIYKYPVETRDVQLSSSAIRFYQPKGKKLSEISPLLIYFHGGGGSLGGINTTDKFCRALVSLGNVRVVSVNYPLAPENPYPQALLCSQDVVKYIATHAADFGTRTGQISLGGDGAGGNLALELINNLPIDLKIKALILYYPLLNTTGQLDANVKREYGKGYGFDSRLWEIFNDALKGKLTDFDRTLPPTLLISAGRDIIIDQERSMAKLNQVKYVEFTDAVHGFITDGHQKTAFKEAVKITNLFLTE